MIKSGHRAPGRRCSMFKGPESGPKVLEHKRAGQSISGGVRKRRAQKMKLERQEESYRL